jgi:hypothetical protein
MARLLYGSLVTQISGSIGGNIFAKGANGFYVKRRTKNKITRSISQLTRRNQFKNVTGSWRTLTSSQQTTFISNAHLYPYINSLGVTSYYTGYQLYSKMNNGLASLLRALITTCPTPVTYPTTSDYYVWWCIGYTTLNLLLAFDLTLVYEVPANFNVLIEATPNLSKGITAPKASLYRTIQILASGDNTDSIDIAASYFKTFGTFVNDNTHTYVRATLVSTLNGIAGVPRVYLVDHSLC